jgi:hypothetical protein
MDIAKATLDEFTPLVGQSFAVTVDEGRNESFVLESAEGRTVIDPNRRQPFALLFSCEILPALPQRIYRFEHELTGALDLFAVPVEERDGRSFYEVVIT